MRKNNKDFLGVSNLKNLKVIITVALFSAISFVFGKFLAIPVGDYMRFSFENLPIILSGILFGPLTGCITGIVADIIGCILRGYAINPILTLGAAIIGFVGGAISNLTKRLKQPLMLIITVAVSHLLGSVIVKSIGLSIWYSMDFLFTLMWRSVNYLVVGIAEIIVLHLILKNEGFKKQIRSLGGGKYEL